MKTPAIVLNRDESGESHRLVTLLCRDIGKLKVFAPGARRSKRRFAGCLELFALIEASILERPQGKLPQLEEASLIDPHENIKSDLIAIGHAGYLAELAAAMLAERDPAVEIFDLLCETLSTLKQGPLDSFALRCFEMAVLVHAGLRPHFSSCISCQADASRNWRFDFEQGGVLCHRCEPAPASAPQPLGRGSLDLLRRIQSGQRPAEIARADMANARSLFARLIDAQVGRPLKAREFLVQIAKKSK